MKKMREHQEVPLCIKSDLRHAPQFLCVGGGGISLLISFPLTVRCSRHSTPGPGTGGLTFRAEMAGSSHFAQASTTFYRRL